MFDLLSFLTLLLWEFLFGTCFVSSYTFGLHLLNLP